MTADPKCERLRGLLADYLGGGLATQEAEELEAHLLSCHACYQELKTEERVRALVARNARTVDRVLSRVEEGQFAISLGKMGAAAGDIARDLAEKVRAFMEGLVLGGASPAFVPVRGGTGPGKGLDPRTADRMIAHGAVEKFILPDGSDLVVRVDPKLRTIALTMQRSGAPVKWRLDLELEGGESPLKADATGTIQLSSDVLHQGLELRWIIEGAA